MTRSLIEWTNETWNPVRGCSRISTGCENCYAERQAHRFSGPGQPYEGLTTLRNGRPGWTGEVRFVPEMLDMPLRWRKPRMVFVNSMSDLFHERVSDDDIDDVFGVMWACEYLGRGDNVYPGHIFQVLTKRAERMRDYMSQDRRERWAYAAVRNGCAGEDPDPLWDQINFAKHQHPRIWLGVSCENQAAADERIPLLLQTPAAVRWVSLEPLLESVSLDYYLRTDRCHADRDGECSHQQCPQLRDGEPERSHRHCPIDDWNKGDEWDGPPVRGPRLDWVVVGSESGPGARPMDENWVRSIREQCITAGVPMFFKQRLDNGRKVSMPRLDGVQWAMFPEEAV